MVNHRSPGTAHTVAQPNNTCGTSGLFPGSTGPPPLVLQLFTRLTELARPDGAWPADDVRRVVAEWLQEHGITNLAASPQTYRQLAAGRACVTPVDLGGQPNHHQR